MADIADLLKNILDDPTTSEKLSALIGGKESAVSASATPAIDPVMLAKITKAMSKMSGGVRDDRTKLLSDLRPYISPARKERLDRAIDMLKMLSLVEILKDEGE